MQYLIKINTFSGELWFYFSTNWLHGTQINPFANSTRTRILLGLNWYQSALSETLYSLKIGFCVANKVPTESFLFHDFESGSKKLFTRSGPPSKSIKAWFIFAHCPREKRPRKILKKRTGESWTFILAQFQAVTSKRVCSIFYAQISYKMRVSTSMRDISCNS